MSKKETKKYSEWTAEEKAAYKAKREAYWKKRDEDLQSNFALLTKELEALKAKPEIMALLAACKKGAGVEKGDRAVGNRETYLTAIFGSETPAIGQVASYLFIGVRGPQGERMNAGETMAQFVTRVGDCAYKYDANTISSMVWYLKKRGHVVENDREKATVTYIRFTQPTEPVVAEPPKAELIKKAK